jgi:hypothetical protein
MNPNYYLHNFVWFMFFALVYVDDALAYIEPGTGSMIIQSLIAVIAGGLFAIKTYWYKLKIFFSRKKNIPPKLEKDHITEHK